MVIIKICVKFESRKKMIGIDGIYNRIEFFF